MAESAARKPTPRPPLLSVVVPTRNEAGNVRPLYTRIAAALPGVNFEVCFVDDSDDATLTVLAQLEAEHENVRCRFRKDADRSGGLSTAVIAGLRMARGKYVCVMDADLQHPPELIPALLDATKDADLVIASRYLSKGSAAGLGSTTRHLVSSGAKGVARILFGEARHSTDPLSGFFLCRRELIDGIEFRPVGFKILLELLVCVPKLRVRDVPLSFASRASGESKATMSQGWLYLKHIWSLFTQVSGSARPWKFATVGTSGLIIFLGLLEICDQALHLEQWATFIAAFLPSLLWNTLLNRRWTFADYRGVLPPASRGYLLTAAVVGGLAFVIYTLLRDSGMGLLLTGVLTVVFVMACNGMLNLRRVSKRPLVWARVTTDKEIVTRLARLAKAIGADRAYLLPADAAGSINGVPPEIVTRAGNLRRASLWTEASSHRAQRRTNIDLRSTLLVPVANGGKTIGVVVCEREQPTAYRANVLERATRAVEELAPFLVAATGEKIARLDDRIRTQSSDES